MADQQLSTENLTLSSNLCFSSATQFLLSTKFPSSQLLPHHFPVLPAAHRQQFQHKFGIGEQTTLSPTPTQPSPSLLPLFDYPPRTNSTTMLPFFDGALNREIFRTSNPAPVTPASQSLRPLINHRSEMPHPMAKPFLCWLVSNLFVLNMS